MRRVLRQLIVIALIVSFAVLTAGCGGIKPSLLDEKVAEMVECYVEQDTERAYSLIYPGIVDEKTFLSAADEVCEYFPVTSDYTMNREDFKYGRGLSSGKDIAEGHYTVEFNETVFHILVQWCSDKDGSGFTTFRMYNEEDWAMAQEAED